MNLSGISNNIVQAYSRVTEAASAVSSSSEFSAPVEPVQQANIENAVEDSPAPPNIPQGNVNTALPASLIDNVAQLKLSSIAFKASAKAFKAADEATGELLKIG